MLCVAVMAGAGSMPGHKLMHGKAEAEIMLHLAAAPSAQHKGQPDHRLQRNATALSGQGSCLP